MDADSLFLLILLICICVCVGSILFQFFNNNVVYLSERQEQFLDNQLMIEEHFFVC